MDERTELRRMPSLEEARLDPASYPNLGGYPEPSPYGYGYSQDDEKVYLRRMWLAVKKRKWLIAVIATIATTVVTIEVFRTKSTYQAVATIEIEKENRTLVRSGDVTISGDDTDDMYYVNQSMKTKIRFLQSRPVLEEVVTRMKLDQTPRFMDITERKPIVEALKTIVSRIRPAAEAQPAVLDADAKKAGAEPQLSAAESARLAPYVGVLAANLSADPLPDTRMLMVSFTHTDPVLAAAVANTAAEVFIDRSFLNRTEKFTNTAGWLDRETREFKAKVEESEQNLANYTKDHNLLSPDGKETLTNEKLARLHDQATRAETERILKESLYQEVKAGRAAQLPEAFSDPKLGALQAKLGELAITSAQLDTRYGPDNPKVVEVKQQMSAVQQQIDASRGQLEEKLSADYDRAVRDERSLRAALDQAKAEAVRQNQANIQFSLLKQDVDTAKSMYTDFLQKTNQAKVQEAEQHNNMHLIESALPPVSPVGPNRLRTIMIGLFVSLLAGLGLTFFIEYFDSTIKSIEDVTRYAQLPALGVIPAISSRRVLKLAKKSSQSSLSLGDGKSAMAAAFPGQLMAVDRHSSIAEAYRVLRTSVLLSTAGGPPKAILVTSGQPGDGKTTTIINTAVALAQLGAKVLVIDCDMRRPAAHKILGVDYTAGLSSYLSRDIEIDGLIQKLPIANLSILPSGPVPPDPAELLSSRRMKDLLMLLAERYDHILLDSPPLMLVTDPIVLSTIVDGVILVIHGGKSTRDVVRRARAELAAVGAKVFGVVLNNLDMRRHGYDSYYYDRYYSDYHGPKAEAPGERRKGEIYVNARQSTAQVTGSSSNGTQPTAHQMGSPSNGILSTAEPTGPSSPRALGAAPFVPGLNPSHRQLLGKLASQSFGAARMLEVGCGAGHLMSSLQKAGWRVEGIEPDHDEAELARRTTGLPVWEGDFRQINLPLGAYQLIVVSRVSPHFDNPVSALFRIEELLAPGGRAVICYPNQASLGARLFREDWFGWEPERRLTLPDCPALEGSARFAGLTGRVRTDWHNAAVFCAFARAYGAGEKPDLSRPSVTWRDRGVAWLERILVLLGFDLGEEIVADFQKRATQPQ